MAWENVPFSSSGNVIQILYDVDSQILSVQYKGGIYEYSPVDASQAAELSQSPSATQFIRDVIKAMAEETRVG